MLRTAPVSLQDRVDQTADEPPLRVGRIIKGPEIEHARRATGLSVKDLSVLTDIDEATIERIEAGAPYTIAVNAKLKYALLASVLCSTSTLRSPTGRYAHPGAVWAATSPTSRGAGRGEGLLIA